MIRKLKTKEKKLVVGFSGIIIGLYMIFVLNNPRGWILLVIGGAFLIKW